MPYEEEFAALSHPLRQQILNVLHLQPATVGDLKDRLNVSQPVISQHLKVLRDTGLVDVTPQGVKRIYRIEEQRLREVRSFLQNHWQSALGVLDEDPQNDA